MIDKYNLVRVLTNEICDPLKTEDFVVQPVVDVSPPKWHMAHTTWFFEEFFLSKYVPDYRRYHPRYSFLFNSYYEGVGDRVLRSSRGNMSRPGVDEIKDYRTYVDEHMIKLIPDLPREAIEFLKLGLNHEQQHQELLYTDIKYILGHNPLFPPYLDSFKETIDPITDDSFVELKKGTYKVGFVEHGFSFDNERNSHEVYLDKYKIRRSLIRNEEYLKFIEEGCYTSPTYWHSDGWAWVKENDIFAPMYWHKIGGKWMRYSFSGLEPINPMDPVTHVSFFEASAFAEWAGFRLPTEFEWEIASDHFKWGQRWEHTNSAYLPYPGFAKADGAIGEYNGKFMVNQMVLRGGSLVTSPGHSRKTYRNFFYPSVQWQFSGIRLCEK